MATKKLFAHPDGVSREYTRILLRYARELEGIVNAVVIPELPALVAQYEQDMRVDSWSSDLDALMGMVNLLGRNAESIVIGKLPAIYTTLSAFNNRQFRQVFASNNKGFTLPDSSTLSLLGLDVYGSDVSSKKLLVLMESWVADNVALIKDMRSTYNKGVETVIRNGIRNGWSPAQLTKQIKAQELEDTPKGTASENRKLDYRAKLIAQDQINKGNADLTKYRLQSVGVTEYIWRDVGDHRVRPTHQEFDGNRYSFRFPENKASPEQAVKYAPEGDPGTPVRCRCRAEAVWPESQADNPDAAHLVRQQAPRTVQMSKAELAAYRKTYIPFKQRNSNSG